MANKKQSFSKKPVQNKQPQNKVEEKKSLLKEAKEPTKGEIIFFKIGMIAISVAVLAFVAFILINHFTTDDSVVYEDYIQISHSSLTEIVKDNDDTTYGDFTYFNQFEEFDNLRDLINKNDVIYLFFYHSSDYDEDIEAAIENQTMINLIPTVTLMDDNEDEVFVAFLFIDLDSIINESIISDTDLDYLGLDESDDQTLVIFDIYNGDGENFTAEEDAADIIEIINAL